MNMAKTLPSMDTLGDIFTCPVCLDPFDDPRILNCGHHFCMECLISISSSHIEGAIPCPTCRKETHGRKVHDLPRPVMVNELQELLGNIILGNVDSDSTAEDNDLPKSCDLCTNIDSTRVSPATWYCYQCKHGLCEACCEKHKTAKLFASHTLGKANDNLFCTTHQKEVFTAYCESCKACVCSICVHAEHSKHDLIDPLEKAKEKKQDMQNFIESQDKHLIDPSVFKEVMGHVTKADEKHSHLKKYLSQVKGYVKKIYDTVNSMDATLDREMQQQRDTVTRKCEQMIKIDTMRKAIVHYAKSVALGKTDLELVVNVPELPNPSTFTDIDISYDLYIPVLSDSAKGFLEELQHVQNNFESFMGHYECISSRQQGDDAARYKIGEMPTEETGAFKKTCSIPLCPGISGITLDSDQKLLVIRTRDQLNPVKIYDYDGIKLDEFGTGIVGLDSPGLITKDAQLQVYLAPADDRIVTIDSDGIENVPVISAENVTNAIGEVVAFRGAFGLGVPQEGHNPMERTFAISTTADDNQQLYKIAFFRLKRGKAIEQLTHGRESGGCHLTKDKEKQYKLPYYIRWCEHLAEPAYVYSDQLNHHVGVISQEGHHRHTYGSYGEGNAQLRQPCGICTDYRGRIIVSDWGNGRVNAFWTEDGMPRWECVIASDSLQGHPYDIAYDVIRTRGEIREILAVELEDRVDIYSFVDRLGDE